MNDDIKRMVDVQNAVDPFVCLFLYKKLPSAISAFEAFAAFRLLSN